MRRDQEDDLRDDGPRFSDGPDQWTPALAGKALVWALRIARYTAGSTHPRSYGSGMPDVVYSKDEIAEMEVADFKRPPTARDITRADSVLFWQARYLAGEHADRECSRVLKEWLRCRTQRRKFDDYCDQVGWARATAYRRRDRALAQISIGLDRDRVPVFRV